MRKICRLRLLRQPRLQADLQSPEIEVRFAPKSGLRPNPLKASKPDLACISKMLVRYRCVLLLKGRDSSPDTQAASRTTPGRVGPTTYSDFRCASLSYPSSSPSSGLSKAPAIETRHVPGDGPAPPWGRVGFQGCWGHVTYADDRLYPTWKDDTQDRVSWRAQCYLHVVTFPVAQPLDRGIMTSSEVV